MKSLETERLTLKMFTLEDAEELYAYARNPNVGPSCRLVTAQKRA